MPLSPTLSGGLAALAAFGIWGFMPVYFKQLAQVPAWEILCHRIIWSSLLTLSLCLILNRRKLLCEVVRQPTPDPDQSGFFPIPGTQLHVFTGYSHLR